MGFWSTKRRPLATNCTKCGMSELLTSCGITDFKQEEYLGEGAKKIAFVAPPRLLDELALGKKYENSYVGRQFADIARPYIDLHKDAIIIPATQKIYRQAMHEGLFDIFMDAGCVVSTPTCGPCLGGHMGILAKGERAIATTNRNFVGRMGHTASEGYLASPAVAAASAITGVIPDPATL